MIFSKEWRETLPLVAASVIAACLISLIRWKGWRLEYFEFQFWVVAVICLFSLSLFLGTNATASEREGGTLDGLLARPVRFGKVSLAKYSVRLGGLTLALLFLLLFFYAARPTHNVTSEYLVKALGVLCGLLLFFLTISFCISCFTETWAKAFIATIISICAVLFVCANTRFFVYTWLWANTLDDLWLHYFAFYAALSLAFLLLCIPLFMRASLLKYEWKHVGVAGIILFFLFMKSVSATSFFLLISAASSGDLKLVQLMRSRVEETLKVISEEKHSSRSQKLRYLLSTSTNPRIERDLIRAFGDENSDVRNMAVHILADRKSKQAVPAVLRLLHDPDQNVRHSALLFVLILKPEEARNELITLLNDPSASIRATALLALSSYRFAPYEKRKAVPYLMEALRNRNPLVCAAAMQQLAAMDYAPAKEEIVRIMFEHPAIQTRANAASALGALKSAPACDELLAALSEKDMRVVMSAVNSLGNLRCRSAVEPLVKAMRDAIRADEERRTVASGQTLIASNFEARRTVIFALKRIGGFEVKRAFRELFSNPSIDPATKMELAIVMIETGDRSSLPYIREWLDKVATTKKPGRATRNRIIRLLQAREFSGMPLFIAWMDEGNPWQRYDNYGKILTEVTGKNYGWDTKRWQKWWEENKDRYLQTAPEGK